MTKRTKDGKEVIEDGETVKINMMMMDSIQRAVADSEPHVLHRPGYAVLSDAQAQQKQALYDAADARLADAWKVSEPEAAETQTTADAPMASLYDRYDARLANAWK